MKNTVKLLILLLVLVLAGGCGNELVDDIYPEQVHDENGQIEKEKEDRVEARVYTACFSADSTRAQLDSDYKLFWSSGDEISVFSSMNNEKYRFQGKTGDTKGTFAKADGTAPGEIFERTYAVYPYNEKTSCNQSGEVAVNFPSTQKYTDHSFDPAANIMLAVTDDISDLKLRFRNASGYLRAQLYGLDNIQSVSLRGNNEETLCGEATIVPGEYNNPFLSINGSGKKITVDCADGVVLSEDKNKPTEFWFAVPPITFVKGFSLDIENTCGQMVTKTVTSSVTIDRNLVKTVSPIKMSGSSIAEFSHFELTDGIHTYKAWEIGNGEIRISVPFRSPLKNLTAVFSHNGKSVTIDGVEQISGQPVQSSKQFYDFVSPITYTLTSFNGTKTNYKVVIFDLPVLVIETPGRKDITSKDVYVTDTKMVMWDTDGKQTDFGSACQIKGRGNSTWGWAKKPYNIKLESKADVLGMPKHKKWCLLANYGDRTLMRNAMSHKIASLTTGLDWAVRGRFIDVILNGKLVGNYWICEKIEVDKNRVPVDSDKGYLLEYDNRGGGYNFKSGLIPQPFILKAPVEEASEDPGGAIRNEIKQYIATFESVLTGGLAGNYQDYIDVNSFVDFMLVDELCGNMDAGSFSNYFHKDVDKVLCAGPVWDFDIYTFSNNYKKKPAVRNEIYYPYLLKENTFKVAVKSRWKELKQTLMAYSVPNYVDSIYADICRSAERNSKIWPSSGKSDYAIVNGDESLPIKDAKDRVLSIYKEQIAWLDEWVASLEIEYDKKAGTNEDFNAQTDRSGDLNFEF